MKEEKTRRSDELKILVSEQAHVPGETGKTPLLGFLILIFFKIP